MLLVCVVGIGVFLFTIYKVCCVWKVGAITRPGSSKGKKKATHRRMQKETNSFNGRTFSPDPPQETTNAAQELVEGTSRGWITSADEDENGREEDDLNVSADVNLHEDVSYEETSDSRGQMGHSVTQLPPKLQNLRKKEQRRHKGSNRSEGHSPQYHVQSAIDSSRIARFLEVENEANATKLEYKVCVCIYALFFSIAIPFWFYDSFSFSNNWWNYV